MDIQSRMAMWDMMRKIRDDFGTTIFLTTHYLEEADQLSDAICIMKRGKGSHTGQSRHLKVHTSSICYSGEVCEQQGRTKISPPFAAAPARSNILCTERLCTL